MCVGYYTCSYTTYIILPQIDNVQCNIHSSTTPVKKLAPLVTRSCSLIKARISAGDHHNAAQYSKTGMTKILKASLQERSIIKYLIGLPQYEKPLRSWPGNRAKMLLKSHLIIKCHSRYIQILQHTPTKS